MSKLDETFALTLKHLSGERLRIRTSAWYEYPLPWTILGIILLAISMTTPWLIYMFICIPITVTYGLLYLSGLAYYYEHRHEYYTDVVISPNGYFYYNWCESSLTDLLQRYPHLSFKHLQRAIRRVEKAKHRREYQELKKQQAIETHIRAATKTLGIKLESQSGEVSLTTKDS